MYYSDTSCIIQTIFIKNYIINIIKEYSCIIQTKKDLLRLITLMSE